MAWSYALRRTAPAGSPVGVGGGASAGGGVAVVGESEVVVPHAATPTTTVASAAKARARRAVPLASVRSWERRAGLSRAFTRGPPCPCDARHSGQSAPVRDMLAWPIDRMQAIAADASQLHRFCTANAPVAS